MRKTITLALGLGFLLIGIAGFIPALVKETENGLLLLNLFLVNGWHNVVHILSGLAALTAYIGGLYYSTFYLRIMAIVYGIITLWGLAGFGDPYTGVLFGLLHVNTATNILHALITAMAMYGGFIVHANNTQRATA